MITQCWLANSWISMKSPMYLGYSTKLLITQCWIQSSVGHQPSFPASFTSIFFWSENIDTWHIRKHKCAMVKSRYIGDGHPTFNRNPFNGYINPYYWVDDHPLLYGNNGSLDPGTNGCWCYWFRYSISKKGFDHAPNTPMRWRSGVAP